MEISLAYRRGRLQLGMEIDQCFLKDVKIRSIPEIITYIQVFKYRKIQKKVLILDIIVISWIFQIILESMRNRQAPLDIKRINLKFEVKSHIVWDPRLLIQKIVNYWITQTFYIVILKHRGFLVTQDQANMRLQSIL